MNKSGKIKRRKTKKIKIGTLAIGGGALISVQSMTKTDTRNVAATVRQIHRLEKSGCQLIRLAVPDREAAGALRKIKQKINLPLVADIHFDYRLALMAIAAGVDALRLNPGNMGSKKQIEMVVRQAKSAGIPIRIGVNSGSLKSPASPRKHVDTARAMVRSAARYIKIFEALDFRDIIISLKASNVLTTVRAYRVMAEICAYPFHLGITAAGPPEVGAVRSAAGLAILLSEGIGDTLRVSLTGDPLKEVETGYEILKTLELIPSGATLVSCPTCGRCEVDLTKVARAVERELTRINKSSLTPPNLKVAVMGCVVNGPGEAREADIGIAGGKDCGILFRKGKIIKKVPEGKLTKVLLGEIKKFCQR